MQTLREAATTNNWQSFEKNPDEEYTICIYRIRCTKHATGELNLILNVKIALYKVKCKVCAVWKVHFMLKEALLF